jgi:DNA (cytosine-5)-methyltransferase 1
MHPVVPVAFGGNNTSGPIDVATAVNAHGGPDLPCGTLHQQPHVVAFQERGREGGRSLEWQEDVSYALRAISGGGCSDWFNVAYRWAVRRGWAEREPAS